MVSTTAHREDRKDTKGTKIAVAGHAGRRSHVRDEHFSCFGVFGARNGVASPGDLSAPLVLRDEQSRQVTTGQRKVVHRGAEIVPSAPARTSTAIRLRLRDCVKPP